jgi:LCP family protein required for cell wall assembly
MTPSPYPTSFSRISAEETARFRKTAAAAATRKDRALEYIFFGLIGLLVIVGVIALYTQYSPSYRTVPNHFADGVKADRLNLLLIGIGGDEHPGGGKELADALMLISLKPSTHQVAVVSIPRDLWVPIGRYGTHRINRAHAIGEDSGYPGGGPGLVTDTVSQVFGQPVHAYARIDFKAFEKIVDDLGGVDIYVQRPFYDFLFHDGFRAGWQHMNGKRALAYARYRYIAGPEGDNYARELRQQQVMAAVRQRLSRATPGELLRLVSSVEAVSDATQTNMTPTQLVWLYRNFEGTRESNIRHVSLKPFMEKFNVSSLADAGEAVRPVDPTFTPVRRLERSVFTSMREVGTPDEIQVAHVPQPAATTYSAIVTFGN